MAGRPKKVGLDYFELDCLLDDNIKLIQAEFGLKGFAVVVKLYQKIYSTNGYYCEWSEETLLLFLVENGLGGDSKNLIAEIVSACIRRGVFSKKLFDKFNILTSSGVQKRYLNATSKRETVELKKEYLLITVGKNSNNVVINSINDGRNSINVAGNAQSREEESKEEYKEDMCASDEDANKLDEDGHFEMMWKLYPLKKGKGSVRKTQRLKLFGISIDEMTRAIDRYKAYVNSIDFLHFQNGSTFFNSGYVDYLDCNYETNNSEEKTPESDDRFSALEANVRENFEQIGIIKDQSIDLGNANEEQIKYLQKVGVL